MPRPRAADGAEPTGTALERWPWLRETIAEIQREAWEQVYAQIIGAARYGLPEPRKAKTFAEWQQAAAEAIEAAQRRRA